MSIAVFSFNLTLLLVFWPQLDDLLKFKIPVKDKDESNSPIKVNNVHNPSEFYVPRFLGGFRFMYSPFGNIVKIYPFAQYPLDNFFSPFMLKLVLLLC